MSFEKKMKQRGNQNIDAKTPNLYEKPHRSIPLWAKIAIPSGTAVLAVAITLAVVIPNLNSLQKTLVPKYDTDYFAATPKANAIQSVDASVVSRTATKTLQGLDAYFAKENNKNYVLSPASYLLAASAVAAVSDGFDLSAFGLVDASKDTKALLESWNFLYKYKTQYEEAFCEFDSGVLHQQVGGTYRFDEEKRKAIADDYIATSVASLKDYHAQATDYFHNHVGLTIPIPDPQCISDSVITYGALKMKDYVPNGFGSAKNDFYVDGKTIQVDTREFGSTLFPLTLPYYEGTNYQAFEMLIEHTSLLFILPNEGVSLESISVSEAYSSFMANKKIYNAVGYVPYFHLETFAEDLTNAMKSKLTGQEVFFSKLLADDVPNNLMLSSVLQTSDFEFNRYGVSGESITVMEYDTSPEPEEHEAIELKVDRPFYAISLKDDFPLFVNKVNDPSK